MSFLLPLAGVFIGGLGAMTGLGGGIVAVPLLLWLGFPNSAAIGASFVNMLFIIAASLMFYGVKGTIDWRTGALLGVGSFFGAYLAVTYVQPFVSERMFRYFFAAFLVVMAVSLILKK